MEIYKTEKMKILAKVWSKVENIEANALKQIETVCSLPYVFKHMAVMPDCHTGYSCPIGSIIVTKNVVVPFFVGLDIGCGMIAVKTDIRLEKMTKDIIKKILEGVRNRIPVGFLHHSKLQEWGGFDEAPCIPIVQQELESAKKQLGTLGGGNHFIEIQKDDNGYIWFMIHSGSRNFGYKIAKEYNRKAQEMCKMWYSNIPVIKGEDGLAFLPIQTKEAEEYIKAMNFALKFALQNRKLMMERVKISVSEYIGFKVEQEINIHHNYAALEHHFGSNVWVHRKGATSAKKDQLGIIPGSQGTCSYIVKGKGNPESFRSCSHGAGRAMSRTKAQKNLDLKNEIEILESQGIIHGIRTNKDLDEASGAYKDIDVVMEEQKDLVDIIVKLTPLAVVKG